MAVFSLDEVRDRMRQFADRLKNDPEAAIVIADGGAPSMVLISWDRYESIIETEEVQRDTTLTDAIEKGAREIAEGKGVPWDEARKQLGWR